MGRVEDTERGGGDHGGLLQGAGVPRGEAVRRLSVWGESAVQKGEAASSAHGRDSSRTSN